MPRIKSTSPAAPALWLLSVFLGVFFLAMGLDKTSWLTDTSGLVQQLHEWLGRATAANRWYIETLALPGAPVFGRLVLVGELAVGAALLAGWHVRLAALVALFMVLNFHFAFGALLELAYLRNGYGPPIIGGLLALAIGGARLPLSAHRR
jgi:uncharacterized membrane protein YphA (DoxX/SURF4 family)